MNQTMVISKLNEYLVLLLADTKKIRKLARELLEDIIFFIGFWLARAKQKFPLLESLIQHLQEGLNYGTICEVQMPTLPA